MNKELLISIKPEHLVNILNGKKTLELRKTVPKDYKGWVNIYCTKSKPYYEPRIDGITQEKVWNIHNDFIYHTDLNGKVVARFWFDEYEEIKERFNGDEYIIEKLDELCLSDYEVKEYLGNKKGYAWHIKKLEIFDAPLSLNDFYSDYDYLDNGVTDEMKLTPIPLKRPPQSYQFVYVKELENE